MGWSLCEKHDEPSHNGCPKCNVCVACGKEGAWAELANGTDDPWPICGLECARRYGEQQGERDRRELVGALRMAVDHLDEACCEGFAANNAPQRQRIYALLRRTERELPLPPPTPEPDQSDLRSRILAAASAAFGEGYRPSHLDATEAVWDAAIEAVSLELATHRERAVGTNEDEAAAALMDAMVAVRVMKATP